MGDPRRIKKKFSKPGHPWEKVRIIEEAKLKEEYAYKNKRELWRVKSMLRGFRTQARKLIGATGPLKEKLVAQLIGRLYRLGLVDKNAKLEDVLGLTVRDLMERRLQTLVFRKGLARTIKQARQFIAHGHIFIGNKKITSPSYLVLREEEDKITFSPSSPLSNPEHPLRQLEKMQTEKLKKEEKVENN